MTSRTLRRRLHHGDVDGKKHEHLEAAGMDALNEPLLGNNGYDDARSEETRSRYALYGIPTVVFD
ncbi:unnamed protein product [Ilex paraguariensis]|uniref:Uncharacterized protein n=1 Tax=Ilex paraguariensis TaxID=185542 RepID=A0ABC8RQ17_9AQUA